MKTAAIAIAAALLGLLAGVGVMRSTAGENGYQAPRTADGKPDFNGIWQAMNTANWDLQGHAASQGKVVSLGAAFSAMGKVGSASAEHDHAVVATSLPLWLLIAGLACTAVTLLL